MRKISLWAKHHSFPAIVSIIIIKILLAVIAFYIGTSLLQMDIHIPFIFCIIALIILIAAAFLYPSRSSTLFSKRGFYIRQKCCDLVIGLCSFVMIGILVNNNAMLPLSNSAIAVTPVVSKTPSAADILSSLQYRDKSSLSKKEKRVLKQEFKKQLRVFTVAKISGKKDDADKALLIILTIVAALGLLYLLAILACSISCSGAEGVAIAVALIGAIAIIWGAAAIIRGINKGPRKEPAYSPKRDQSL